MTAHSVGRMQVQCRLHAVVVHVVYQVLRGGDECLVPAPSRPSALVPVHIHNEHIHRHIVILRVTYNLLELGLFVGPVAAIPIAEDVLWRHGDTPCHLDEVAQALPVFVAVAQEVPVYSLTVQRLPHPGNTIHRTVEGEGTAFVATLCLRRFVQNGPSVT